VKPAHLYANHAAANIDGGLQLVLVRSLESKGAVDASMHEEKQLFVKPRVLWGEAKV
jgi:hypothetical protein